MIDKKYDIALHYFIEDIYNAVKNKELEYLDIRIDYKSEETKKKHSDKFSNTYRCGNTFHATLDYKNPLYFQVFKNEFIRFFDLVNKYIDDIEHLFLMMNINGIEVDINTDQKLKDDTWPDCQWVDFFDLYYVIINYKSQTNNSLEELLPLLKNLLSNNN